VVEVAEVKDEMPRSFNPVLFELVAAERAGQDVDFMVRTAFQSAVMAISALLEST